MRDPRTRDRLWPLRRPYAPARGTAPSWRDGLFTAALTGGAWLAGAAPCGAQTAAPPSATERMVQPSAYHRRLAPLVGAWQVRQTIVPEPGARPLVDSAIVARRALIGGQYLEEVMAAAPGAPRPFTRVAYLGYNNVNQRWEYVSMDTRFPRMMYEVSDDAGAVDGRGADTVALAIDAFVLPGWGPALTGQSAKQRRLLVLEGPDRVVSRQYWTLPAGREWLAVEYVYTRARLPAGPRP